VTNASRSPPSVADPQVVVLVVHQIVEYHEVDQQNLVHAADRLEALQAVLGRLGLDMGRLVGQQRARRVHALPAPLEHGGHRVLGEPVDLQVGMEPAQLLGDRGVPLSVPQPDRRGDVQRALAARPAAHPAPRRRRQLDEVAQQQVDPDRITRLREVAAPSSVTSLPPVASASPPEAKKNSRNSR
jgi:hypothetical protein